MPIACSSSALTGQSGSVYYTPAGTTFCLKDFTDFPAGADITVPAIADFRVGDPVVFSEEDGGSIDTALTAGTGYYVVAVSSGAIQVSASKGGTAVTLNGDGGTGTADSAGHINVKFDPFQAISNVQSYSIEISREELDTTTLPSGVGNGGGKYAAFRSTQPGYASATGTMTVFFSDNVSGLGNRMLGNVLMREQEGARIRLFNNTVSDGAATPAPDLAVSSFIEGDITLTGVTLDINPDDPQQGEISFSIQNITNLFTTSLV